MQPNQLDQGLRRMLISNNTNRRVSPNHKLQQKNHTQIMYLPYHCESFFREKIKNIQFILGLVNWRKWCWSLIYVLNISQKRMEWSCLKYPRSLQFPLSADERNVLYSTTSNRLLMRIRKQEQPAKCTHAWTQTPRPACTSL